MADSGEKRLSAEELAALVGELSDEKRELLELLLKEQGMDLSETMILPEKREFDETWKGYRMPLSFSQHRMWFLDQFEPGSPLYNLPTALQLEGDLNVDALRRSFAEIVRRHEILRTIFVSSDGQPYQVILPNLELDIPTINLSGLSEPERQAEVMRLATEDAQQPFNLTTGPLLRVRLLILSQQEHVVLLNTHHIISDGWSIGILFHELGVIYGGFSRGEEPLLPKLPIQYADFAKWQRNFLQGAVVEEQLTYWRDKLTGSPPVLELPTDRPKPAVLSKNGSSFSFKLPIELSKQLQEISQQEGATIFMTLLSAFQVLLSRYTGQEDICVGTPIANRTRAEVEGLIGFFVNTLVLRGDLSDRPTFRQFLTQMRETTLQAYAHQELPFEVLVEKLDPDRDMSHSPLFQVMFSMLNTPMRSRKVPGLVMSNIFVDSGTAKFDLTLLMSEVRGQLNGAIEYNTDLFDAQTIERMASHYQTVLESICRDQDCPIGLLEILPAAERQQILFDWNDTGAPVQLNRTLQALFEDQVLRSPGAPAVMGRSIQPGESGLYSLDYAALNERANQLAHYLRKQGVKPDTLVGLMVDRSVELLVGLMGILKAGGAYLPLDPAYPLERLSYILGDAQTAVLITQSGQVSGAGADLLDPEMKVIQIDADWEPLISQESRENPVNINRPDHLAYVIYTSGSTGRPKGVMIEHASVINLWAALSRKVLANHIPIDLATNLPEPGTEQLRISMNAPLLFDASVQGWVMLLSGLCVVVIPQDVRQDGRALMDYLALTAIDVLDCVPTQLKMLIDAGFLGDITHRDHTSHRNGHAPRAIMPGGEAIDSSTWQLLSQAEGVEFYNMYGPTECTVDSTIGWVKDTPSRPSIGKPVVNAKLYVLDANMRPLPIGVPGELFIAGAGVGRGYLNRPELTAEKFIPNPFTVDWDGKEYRLNGMNGERANFPTFQSSNRLYRTGDLVRYLPDGSLEFLGRIDDQVKLRGFRIELGEIETVLSRNSEVHEAAVLVREIKPNDQQLVAFISLNPPTKNFSLSELREYLKEYLPDYMLPTLFMILDKLPLTPNAKIDRKSLSRWPLENAERARLDADYELPRTPEEEIIANLYAQVLKVEKVGVHDSFFELGGHSLLATQLISRLGEIFQQEIPLRVLFEAPTVARLAERLKTGRASQLQTGESLLGQLPIVPLARDPETRTPNEPPVLSFAQQRLWFLDQFEPGTPNYNIPSVLRLNGKLDVPALESSLNEIVRRHEVLRTAIHTVDGQPVQVVLPDLKISLPLVDIRQLPGPEREGRALQMVMVEARQPFDLSHAPLFRVKLIRLSEDEHLAILTMHHIVSDGWSAGVLVRELALFYSTLAGGGMLRDRATGAALLPDLEIQYADYAAWQREWLQGDELAEQLEYWERQLGDLPPVLDLPTDRPRPVVQTVNGGLLSFVIETALVQALNALSQEMGVTLFMTLLGAFQVLLMRYSGQENISVGSPIANRTRSEIEDLIGFFVNTLVLRTDLSGEPTFREVLKRVRETALGAYAHQDVPFEMLVNELQPERDTSHNPLFQVMFVMQNLPGANLELPGLKLSGMEVTTGTALFDLTLTIAGEARDGLHAAFEYNTDLFVENTIQRMIDHLKVLLTGLISQPDQPVSSLPLMTETERRQILHEWNQIDLEQLKGQGLSCVHQLFERQAALTPTAEALIAGDRVVTYKELNQKANQLAHFLLENNLGAETLVGLCVDRSVEMIVGLLGILKAGCAYVPLDPNYPKERLAFMLDDIRADVVLTLERLTQALPDGNRGQDESARRILLDRDWGIIAQFSTENPLDRVTGDQLAYVIYTSGSTGRPKGVQIQHSALANFVNWARKRYRIQPHDRVLQFASLNFDTAVEEIFPALTAGARLVLRPEAAMTSFQEFHRVIESHLLTVLDLPTAYWHAWVAELAINRSLQVPPSVRLVIVGGEQAQLDSYAAWRNLIGDQVAWINTYGPSEATVVCLTYEPPEDWGEHEPLSLPIGYPVDNTQAYIVDPKMQLLPVGVPGELVIGGAGLAHGYLNLPELTAEKFVPNPFTADRGDKEQLWEGLKIEHSDAQTIKAANRLYHTGDRARYLPGGAIEFLGRVDNQVKLRGMRIELGEIETALRQHIEVRDALVLARQDQTSNEKEHRPMRLVAYVIPVQQPAVNENSQIEEALREFLKEKLPSYMLPSALVFLDAFPLTPNGKIDRKALPVPETGKTYLEESRFIADGSPRQPDEHRDNVHHRDIVAPRTREEGIILDIWKQLLGLDQVSIFDNFFELGGDSILSIQVTSRANQAGLQITPRQIFEKQTIAELAAQAVIGAGDIVTTQTRQGPVHGASPLTPVEHWFFEQKLPNPSHFNQSVMFEVKQTLDPVILEKTLVQLMNHHDALRSCFKQTDTGITQFILDSDELTRKVPFEYVDLEGISPEEVKQAIEAKAEGTQSSLDIFRGPLLRLVYFNLGPGKPGRLLFVIHHLVVDGVSWRILLEDLQNVYLQVSQLSEAAEVVQLPAKSTSYQFWAQELNQYAQSPEASQELDYWKRITNLSGDKIAIKEISKIANLVGSTQVFRDALSVEETRLLLQEVPAVYSSEINDVLLAALVLAYRDWNIANGSIPEVIGETSLFLTLEGHGREDIFPGIDLSRTVGWFTSIYPVRLTIRDFDGPGEVIKKVKEQLRQIPRHGIGYGILRYLRDNNKEDLGDFDLPDISFNYLGQVDRTLTSNLFGSAPESSGHPIDPNGQRAHLIEIDGGVVGGRLGMSWSYSENIFQAATIAALAGKYMNSLRSLIEHCMSPEAGGFTASDFPLAGMDQASLDKVLSSVYHRRDSKLRKKNNQ